MNFSPARLALIIGVAIAAHLVVIGVQALGRRVLQSRVSSEIKVHTVTGFVSSLLVFAIYFGAAGFALSELGVSLTTYFASASVIGLAVSFGSQGVVQDVITGLTVVFSDLLDVGDMVDLGGQVGIVEAVGMRFTVLVNFSGARVFVPNRSIANVINYPNGYIRAYLDARLPADPALHEEAERRLKLLAQASYEQYPGILLLPPTRRTRAPTSACPAPPCSESAARRPGSLRMIGTGGSARRIFLSCLFALVPARCDRFHKQQLSSWIRPVLGD